LPTGVAPLEAAEDPADEIRLVAREVACRRGGRLLFERLSFTLGPGDLLYLRGPNGSGKSSLLRLLAGLLPPAAGEVALGNEAIAHDPAAYRARLHFLGFANALRPTLTLRENMAFARGVLGGKGGLKAALDSLDLAALADTPVRYLSTGQRRRAALARLLTAPRPLWLLDEPEAGLDAAARERLGALVTAQCEAGGIVIIAGHDVAYLRPTIVVELGHEA
jgi:heme exporter protein A